MNYNIRNGETPNTLRMLHRCTSGWVIIRAMKHHLSKIEARLEALIEGSAARLFSTRARQKDLASQLIESMENGVSADAIGEPVAPNLFSLWLPPSQAQELKGNRALLEGLAHTLYEAGREAGYRFDAPPVVRVIADGQMARGELRVKAVNSRSNLPETGTLHIEPTAGGEEVPQNAFFIVDGTRIFTLDQAVINIGRREDNHLVIPDPRISRVHAQLRAVQGRYMIFDLGSRGGTMVNGERVHQTALYPGDVVSLSGVPLVYGQDPAGLEDTQAYETD